jgi:hypothetical protein
MTLFQLRYLYNVAWKSGCGWRLEKAAVFPERHEKIRGKPQGSRLRLGSVRTKYVLNSKRLSIVPLRFCGANSCSK